MKLEIVTLQGDVISRATSCYVVCEDKIVFDEEYGGMDNESYLFSDMISCRVNGKQIYPKPEQKVAQEKMLFNIPAESKWHTDDVEKKAKELGFSSKSEFMREALSLFMALDESTVQKARKQSSQDYLPVWYHIKESLKE